MLRVKCYMAVSKINEITKKYMNPAVHASMHATAF